MSIYCQEWLSSMTDLSKSPNHMYSDHLWQCGRKINWLKWQWEDTSLTYAQTELEIAVDYKWEWKET